MSKQRHDLGYQKKKKASQVRKPRDERRFERMKRNHPGPLPHLLRNLQEWRRAGRPLIKRPKG